MARSHLNRSGKGRPEPPRGSLLSVPDLGGRQTVQGTRRDWGGRGRRTNSYNSKLVSLHDSTGSRCRYTVGSDRKVASVNKPFFPESLPRKTGNETPVRQSYVSTATPSLGWRPVGGSLEPILCS